MEGGVPFCGVPSLERERQRAPLLHPSRGLSVPLSIPCCFRPRPFDMSAPMMAAKMPQGERRTSAFEALRMSCPQTPHDGIEIIAEMVRLVWGPLRRRYPIQYRSVTSTCGWRKHPEGEKEQKRRNGLLSWVITQSSFSRSRS